MKLVPGQFVAGQFVAERREWSGPLPHRVYHIGDDLRYRIVATNEPGRDWVAVSGFGALGTRPMDASDLVNLVGRSGPMVRPWPAPQPPTPIWSAGEPATGGFEWAQNNPGVFATCTLG